MSEYHPDELPEPPPMRVGYSGDTVGRDGVRRKADGTLRTWYPETVAGYAVLLTYALMGASMVYLKMSGA